MGQPDEMSRLQAALDLHAEWSRGRHGDDRDAFLAAHAELRDLLEPLFDDEAEGVAEPGTDRPRRLGDYELLREIGRGGMGVVFEARQVGLERRVAVKVLSDALNLAPRTVARFRREAATAARLDHPAIVGVHATGEVDGVHWFAMELIDGLPLDEHVAALRSTRPDAVVRETVELCARIADALHFAHEAGVVHRDVKPSNVLVRQDGTPVLTDFGLAREQGLPSLSQTGDFAGTPYYVSPEQALGTGKELDRRTDVFSLGVTLYELLTERRPFPGESSDQVLVGILTRDPPDPQKVAPTLNRDIAAILLKALEKERDRRYESAAAFAADLRNFLAFRPVVAKRAGALRRLTRAVRREPLKVALWGILAVGLPTVGWLGYRLIDQQQAAAVGERAITRQTVEERLLEATRAKFLQDLETAEQVYAEILDLAPDEPMAVAEVALHHCRIKRDGVMVAPGQALAVLDARPELLAAEPGLRRIRLLALDELGRSAEAEALRATLGEPATAMEHYVAGYQDQAALQRGDAEKLASAFEHLRTAVLRAPKPNPVYLSTLFVLASLVEDEAIEREAVAALLHLWPDAPAPWIFETLYWYERDDARTEAAAREVLARLPGYYWAHWKIGEMQERRGEVDAALASYEAAWAAFRGDPVIAVALAELHREADQLARTYEVYTELGEQFPIALDVQRERGAILVELGRYAEAVPILERVAEDPEFKSDAVQELLEEARAGR